MVTFPFRRPITELMTSHLHRLRPARSVLGQVWSKMAERGDVAVERCRLKLGHVVNRCPPNCH
jgi:hypothetical protein